MDAKTPVKPPAARRADFHALATQFLTATAVLMVAALILVSVGLSHLKDSLIQSRAAENTLLEITTIESRLMDLDGTLNGYILTGDALYGNRMRDDHAELHAAMKKLRHSLQSDPAQLRRYAALTALEQEHEAIVTRFEAQRARDAAGTEDLTRRARLLTDRARTALWDILITERDQRFANHTAMIEQAETSLWISIGIVFLTFVFGAACVMLTRPRKQTNQNGA